ncbi:MAG: glycosyltransferase [Ginsengibacter sp.]
MRILFFIDSLEAGGKERRLTELMKELKKEASISFEVVVMNKHIHYQEVLNLGVNIHYLIRQTKKDLSAFKKFYKICKNFNPEIVHCWDSMTAIYAVPACKLLGIKLVNGLVVDTPVNRDSSNKHWLRAKITFPFSDLVVGNSNAGLAAYNAPSKKSACVYNGMDLNRFKNLKARSQVLEEIFGNDNKRLFIAGMVAAFEDRKDYKTLIKAATKLVEKFENIRFLLIGEGSNLESIKESVPSSFTNKIIFLGKRTDIESIIQIFDVGILLTNSKVHGEGISNSLIEYLATGIPAVATRGGGTDEVILNERNGFLIDAENEDQLINKIESILQDRQLKEKLGKNGLAMAKEKFDLKTMTKNYISIYKKLIKENNN